MINYLYETCRLVEPRPLNALSREREYVFPNFPHENFASATLTLYFVIIPFGVNGDFQETLTDEDCGHLSTTLTLAGAPGSKKIF